MGSQLYCLIVYKKNDTSTYIINTIQLVLVLYNDILN